jgi:hypothetical protein
MDALRHPLRSSPLLLVLAVLFGCQGGRSTISLDVSIDPPDLPVTGVELTVLQGGQSLVERDFHWEPSAAQFGLFLPSGVSGRVTVEGRGLSAAGEIIAFGQAPVSVTPGQISDSVALVLFRTPDAAGRSRDAEAPDAADDTARFDGAFDGASDATRDRGVDDTGAADAPIDAAVPDATAIDAPVDAARDVVAADTAAPDVAAPDAPSDPVARDVPADIAVDLPGPDLALDITPDLCGPACQAVCGPADTFCPPGCSAARDPDCRHGNGTSCSDNGECRSGACTDGVCCPEACHAACYSCATGDCLPVRDAPDPECVAPATCDSAGVCLPPPAAAPRPLHPQNGEATGSPFAGDGRRPRFIWAPVAGARSYELQVDDTCPIDGFATCTLPSPELAVKDLQETSYQAAAPLAVATKPPVGRRYFWRVRACNPAGCSPWSHVRYVDVGRQTNDFNGDGYADVLAGTWKQYAALYLGRPTANADPPIILGAGETPYAAGDVNGDGFADMLLVDTSNGRASIILGAAIPHTVVDFTATGTPLLYGVTAAGVGDVNGDGYADVIVGSSAQDPNDLARAYLYLGGKTMSMTWAGFFFGALPGDQTGPVLGHLGDINGDGYADVGLADGRNTQLFYGGPVISTAQADVTFSGSGVLLGGDFNGDGYGDLVLGGSGANIYFGGSPGDFNVNLLTPDVMIPGMVMPSAVGDVNGDGFSDLLVSHIRASNEEGVELYLGGAPPTGVSAVKLTAPMPAEAFGWAVSVVGDINGDGFADVAIGAPDNTVGGYGAGQVYAYFGGAPFKGVVNRSFGVNQSETNLGTTLALLWPRWRGFRAEPPRFR